MTSAALSADREPGGSRPLTVVLVGLNAACLLEPAIGVAWQLALGRATDTPIRWHHAGLLALGLWLVYATDRHLDARSMQRPATVRHAFFARHASKWSAAIGVLAGVSVILALLTLTAVDWGAAAVAGGLAASYLWLVHGKRVGRTLKKGLAALVYTFGVGVFLWPRTEMFTQLALGQVLLASLASSNLALISAFESNVPARERRGVRFGTAWLAIGAAAISLLGRPDTAMLPLSVATSALVLIALSFSDRTHRELAHALADVALLLPLSTCL